MQTFMHVTRDQRDKCKHSCMQTFMHVQAHKHNMQMHMGSHFDLKGFFKVSLPALQVPANNQSMAASSLDPEVAFGPQRNDPEVAFGPQEEWVSPRLESPWVGHNAVSLIPVEATEEQVIEALELWGMPVEAWPKTGKKKSAEKLVSYHLHKKGQPDISVYLNRQMFTTKPQLEKHTYFSFWMSPEFEVGPVANPYCTPGFSHVVSMSKGYNHCNAALAFGEIQLLAGWADASFLLQWNTQFNLHRNPDQQFPPVLHEWILWQERSRFAVTKMSTNADQLHDVHDHQAPAQPNQLPDVEELKVLPAVLLMKSTSANQLQEVHDHQAPAQPDQLPDASFQLLDVDQIYLTHHNGGASIINAKKIGPDAKKKMVDGKEVIKLCDDGLHRVVWEVPMAGVDSEWQCV